MKEKNFDELIDKLLSKPAPIVESENFEERVVNAALLASEEDAKKDKLTDSLLAKLVDFPDITDSTLSIINRIKYDVRKMALSMTFAATLSACAAFAVMVATTTSAKQKFIVGEVEFLEMSKLDDEINNISYLVMQEEMLDLIR